MKKYFFIIGFVILGIINILLIYHKVTDSGSWHGKWYATVNSELFSEKEFPEMCYDKALELYWIEFAKYYNTNSTCCDYEIRSERENGYWRFHYRRKSEEGGYIIGGSGYIIVKDSGEVRLLPLL